jgi:hypothetical protein
MKRGEQESATPNTTTTTVNQLTIFVVNVVLVWVPILFPHLNHSAHICAAGAEHRSSAPHHMHAKRAARSVLISVSFVARHQKHHTLQSRVSQTTSRFGITRERTKRKSARVCACSRVMQDVMGEMVEEGDEGKGRGTHALCHRPSARRATRPPQVSLPPHAHPHRPRTHPHSRLLPPPHLRRPPLGRLRRGLLNAEVSGDRSGAGGAWEAVEVGGGGGGVGNNCVIVLRVPCSLLLADTSTHENTPRTSHQRTVSRRISNTGTHTSRG